MVTAAVAVLSTPSRKKSSHDSQSPAPPRSWKPRLHRLWECRVPPPAPSAAGLRARTGCPRSGTTAGPRAAHRRRERDRDPRHQQGGDPIQAAASQQSPLVQCLKGTIKEHGRIWRQRCRHEGVNSLTSGAGDLVAACAFALHGASPANLEQAFSLLKDQGLSFNKAPAGVLCCS